MKYGPVRRQQEIREREAAVLGSHQWYRVKSEGSTSPRRDGRKDEELFDDAYPLSPFASSGAVSLEDGLGDRSSAPEDFPPSELLWSPR